MDINHLNALRLGFSTKEAKNISKKGLVNYINDQLFTKNILTMPEYIVSSPKSLRELQISRNISGNDGKRKEEVNLAIINARYDLKAYIIQRCNESNTPLSEKINLFFQNHFVVTFDKVRLPYYIFKHYETINSHALGNYKTLVKEMVFSNAMIKYLDNQQNKSKTPNENLGRELLELFTLGEGNYTESDVKNTALALAGLTLGEEKGIYNLKVKDNSIKNVFGKTGNFNINHVIDIIFEQKNTPYLLTEKVLKWFFYDLPPKELIIKYGDVLKNNNFELKPFFQYLFIDECKKSQGGNQIKNPLTYFLQIHYDLGLNVNYRLISYLISTQGMDIYDQLTVKGWNGGQDWINHQIYAERNLFVDFLIDKSVKFENILKRATKKYNFGSTNFNIKLDLENKSSAKTILNELKDKMIFESNDEINEELNQILKYDFDPKTNNADIYILRAYQYLAKSPEFQII